MKLQKNTMLALSSVLEIAGQPQRHLAAGEIAEKYKVSSHHLAKVLAELVRAGLVESVRGAGGGYRFAANARRLTLDDVIRCFEDNTPAAGAQRDAGERTPAGRAIATVLSEIDEIERATFRSITIATMLRIMARQDAAAPARRPRR